MEALLTARRTKEGLEDAFRRRWRGGNQPEGMRDAYLLEDEADPRETLSISFWERPGQLLAYRTSEAAKQREQQLQGVVETQRWQRPFAAFGVADISTGGRKLPLLLPLLLLVTAAAVVVYVMKKRRGHAQADEATGQHPASASGEAPPVEAAPTMASVSVSGSERPTPSAGAPGVSLG